MPGGSSSPSSSPPSSSSISHVLRELFAGCGAGMAGLTVGYPLDTVKVRQQISGTKTMETFLYVAKTHGVSGYFRGLFVPLITTGLIKAVVFGTYTSTLDCMVALRNKDFDKNRVKNIEEACTLTEAFVAGMVAGVPWGIMNTPVELVKVQMQIDGGKTMTNPWQCVRRIYTHKGAKGCLTGLRVTLLRDIHASGFYYLIYKALSDRAKEDAKAKGKAGPGSVALFFAGGMAGLAYWMSNMPIDRIKSKIQGASMTGSTTTKAPGIIECAKQIHAADGLRGFYKGFTVVTIRAVPVSGVIFVSYDYFRRAWDFMAGFLKT